MAQEVSFKDTLNLPRTDFPIRPNSAIDDPALVARWQAEDLYHATFKLNEGAPQYVLHDGPPYANGNLHLGHAYDGVLKDIMTKAKRMSGMHVPLTPGWDCHGLPIEIKVLQESSVCAPLDVKKACRAYAQKWVDIQREEFKRFGILMDWAHPYITMSPDYEYKTVRSFGILLERGFIERKNKTVPWCFVCKTVLAAAEIEYQDRKDPSVYVLFPLEQSDLFADVPLTQGNKVSLLVWTTTPWTLPLNRALLLKTGASYVLARIDGQLVILGAQALPRIAQMMGKDAEVLKTFPADFLATARAQPPFGTTSVPVIFDESVGLDEGTACVHVAPGCGPLDYELGVKHGLEIYSPVSADGAYCEGIYPQELKGMAVTKAQGWVINALTEQGKLFYKNSITHSYPHCWRCHTGLIFRATKQWFFDLQHNSIKDRAVAAVDSITFMPPQGRNFLRATVESRWEWCLSRQRIWGVPIPALLCMECDTVFCTPEFVNRVADGVAAEGIEYWDKVSVEELVRSSNASCQECGNKKFVKEKDILDVWFEAGISHYAVLYHNPELAFPADLYLEGVDQHRGWFQSSLLTALVIEGVPPMKAIMTHGFTVDEKGQKMSKSLGNVIVPEEIIKQVSTDGLRLWVASVGHEGDAVISARLLQNVGEVLRKIRNTARFLLSNLYDFDSEHDLVPFEDLMLIDKGALAYASAFNCLIKSHYAAGHFTGVFHALTDFTTVYLSSWYLDIIKDRLYVELPSGLRRRSAQTACWYILDMLTHLMAPVLSFTAEYLSDAYQKDKKNSIHMQPFVSLPLSWQIGESKPDQQVCKSNQVLPESFEFMVQGNPFIAEWELLRELRSAVLKLIEVEREKGAIKHSLEAHITLYASPEMRDYEVLKRFMARLAQAGQSVEDFFKEFLIVSNVKVVTSKTGLEQTAYPGWYCKVEHARGTKCPRCWNWDEGERPHGLDRRCFGILTALKSPLV